MSHFKAKMRQILFPASVRSSVRLCLDTVDESHRRRHGVTAAIVVDVVGALRQCVSSSVCPSFRSCQTPSKRRTDGRPSLRWSLTLSGYAHVQCICATLWCHCHTAIMKLAFDLFQTCCSVFLQPSVFLVLTSSGYSLPVSSPTTLYVVMSPRFSASIISLIVTFSPVRRHRK